MKKENIKSVGKGEVMSDLISRTGAIAHFDKVAEELDEQRGDDSWVGNAFKICLLGVVNDLAALPSAEPQWIPVSERLPIPPTFCLVTTDGSHGDVIDIALYMSDGWHKASEVLAWMPLPPPYEGDDEHE